MRELNTIQKVEKLNKVYAVDEPGNGGANHEYMISGVISETPVRKTFGEKIIIEDDADFTKLNLDDMNKFYFCSYEKCEEFCDWYNSTIKNIDINGLSDDRGNPVRKRRTRD